MHEFACLINGAYRACMMDPSKLKVVELRAELSNRGLDTKGNKPVLVERLRKALEEEETQECKSCPCLSYIIECLPRTYSYFDYASPY